MSTDVTVVGPSPGPDSDSARGSDFALLARRIDAAGLLDRRPGAYAVRISATLVLYAAAWGAVVWIGDSWWQTIMAVVLGVAFTQVAFLSHDGGHKQIFTSSRVNDLFGKASGNVLIGVSYGWWVGKHNRHHANPNKEDHDPDIGDGALAFTTGQVAARVGWLGRLIARRQAWLFFPLTTLEGINLHASSVASLRAGRDRSARGGSRRSEFGLLVVHAVLYLGVVLSVMSPLTAVVFVVIQQAVWGLYMGASFAPNHKGMPIIAADEKIDFLRRQVLTSRNVRGGRFTDLVLGGLNYQIEHHLFPNMPRASLRHAQHIVRSYCAETDVPYCETSLFGSYAIALRYLNGLGAPLRTEPCLVGAGAQCKPAKPDQALR